MAMKILDPILNGFRMFNMTGCLTNNVTFDALASKVGESKGSLVTWKTGSWNNRENKTMNQSAKVTDCHFFVMFGCLQLNCLGVKMICIMAFFYQHIDFVFVHVLIYIIGKNVHEIFTSAVLSFYCKQGKHFDSL